MTPKIKTIIIIVAAAAALILIYFLFLKPGPDEGNLVTATDTGLPNVNNSGATGAPDASADTSLVAKDFLALLLNVQSIKLNDAIFADTAFLGLHDSTIILTPDGTEGRPNPFAQFGNDIAPPPATPPTTPPN